MAAIGAPLLASRGSAQSGTAGASSLNLTAGGNVIGCNLIAICSVIVDKSGKNPGCLVPGLVFALCENKNTAVSGISSAQVAGSPNFNGLDFYTNGTKRVSIAPSGCVTIGTAVNTNLTAGCTRPCATLTVSSEGSCVAANGLPRVKTSILGSSCLGVGVQGITRGCLTSAAVCGHSLGAGGCISTGKGIGVRGISGNAPGVTGTSSQASGVVGTTTAILPCIKSPTLACVAGVTGRSIGTCGNITTGKGIGVRGVSGGGPGVSGLSCLSSGVVATTKGNACTAALCATSLCLSTSGSITLGAATGVRARSGKGPALQGSSLLNVAICAQSSVATVGKFSNSSKVGDRSTLIQFQPGTCSSTNTAGCITLQTWSAGVSGPGNVCSVPVGSFYIGRQGKPGIVLGPTGLQVKGNISTCGGITNSGGITARTVSLTASPTVGNYQMQPSCFAVLVDASGLSDSGRHDDEGEDTFTVTLPPASTSSGMMVFIDKTDKSHNSVTVVPNKGDTICSYPKLELRAVYSSVQLISDGKNTWFRLSCTGATTPQGGY